MTSHFLLMVLFALLVSTVFATLMQDNARDGRRIDERITALRVLEERPPPAGTRGRDDVADRLLANPVIESYEVSVSQAPAIAERR